MFRNLVERSRDMRVLACMTIRTFACIRPRSSLLWLIRGCIASFVPLYVVAAQRVRHVPLLDVEPLRTRLWEIDLQISRD